MTRRVLLLLPLLIGPSALLRAAVITVDATADDRAVDGACTLREAILAANTNLPVDGCPAGDAGPTIDVIVLPAATYTLSFGPAGDNAGESGDLDLGDDVQLLGATGGGSIIDADGLDRVLDVRGGTAAIVVNLTLTGGQTSSEGGGIRNGGDLTLLGSTVTGNTASGPGGGVRNDGVMSIFRSTLSGNTTLDHGGGIDNHGTLELDASTVAGNTVVGGGAGGGVYVLGGESATIADSTIAGNTAGGGTALHCGGTVEILNTIVDGSCDAPVASSFGGNLESPGDTCDLGLSDLVDVADPLLGPLADNGGSTLTMALLPGSPAIDAGDGCGALDQRSARRPVDGDGTGGTGCDVGAFEAASDAPFFRDGFELGHALSWTSVTD